MDLWGTSRPMHLLASSCISKDIWRSFDSRMVIVCKESKTSMMEAALHCPNLDRVACWIETGRQESGGIKQLSIKVCFNMSKLIKCTTFTTPHQKSTINKKSTVLQRSQWVNISMNNNLNIYFIIFVCFLEKAVCWRGCSWTKKVMKIKLINLNTFIFYFFC